MGLIKKTTYVFRTQDGKEFPLNDLDIADLKRELEVSPIQDWRILAMSGKKIDAIRRVREITKAGLKEAKDAVERYTAIGGTEYIEADRYITAARNEAAPPYQPSYTPPPPRYGPEDADGEDYHDDIPF